MEHLKGKYLIIRVDADIQIGAGHLMRCLALAQAWKDAGGKITFITSCQNKGLLRRLREEESEICLLAHTYPDPGDWDYTKGILAAHPDAWVVLDGYHFDEVYQRWMKETGLRLLVIDDMAHLKCYYADIVLNQNIHANEELYENREPYTQLLLGNHYVLLRQEFWKWRGWKRQVPQVARKILVTFGGGDPDNVTFKVIQALHQVEVDGLETEVVVGGSNPNYVELQAAVCDSRFPIRLKSNVANMPELMAWPDIAISAGGTTSWELAFMGLPSIVLILADNQRPIAERLNTKGVAVNLGWHKNLSSSDIAQALTQLLVSEKSRVELSRRGQKLVDGEGSFRVLKALVGDLGGNNADSLSGK